MPTRTDQGRLILNGEAGFGDPVAPAWADDSRRRLGPPYVRGGKESNPVTYASRVCTGRDSAQGARSAGLRIPNPWFARLVLSPRREIVMRSRPTSPLLGRGS